MRQGPVHRHKEFAVSQRPSPPKNSYSPPTPTLGGFIKVVGPHHELPLPNEHKTLNPYKTCSKYLLLVYSQTKLDFGLLNLLNIHERRLVTAKTAEHPVTVSPPSRQNNRRAKT